MTPEAPEVAEAKKRTQGHKYRTKKMAIDASVLQYCERLKSIDDE